MITLAHDQFSGCEDHNFAKTQQPLDLVVRELRKGGNEPDFGNEMMLSFKITGFFHGQIVLIVIKDGTGGFLNSTRRTHHPLSRLPWPSWQDRFHAVP